MIFQYRSKSKFEDGFSLIEILMSLILIGVLAAVSINVIGGDIDENKFDLTVEEMNQIKNAMIGNEELRDGGVRTSFGFVGDIGRLPTNAEGIAALVTKPVALPNWSVNATARFGAGWNGPYLLSGSSDTDFTTDAWGTAYVYDSTLTPPTIISRGADRVAGGTGLNQDITVSLPAEKRIGNVHGFIQQNSVPYAGTADVRLYSVTNGAVVNTIDSVLVADAGRYEFTNIPFGVRSLIVYEDGVAAVGQETIGPVIFAVDKPNVLVPSEQTNLAP